MQHPTRYRQGKGFLVQCDGDVHYLEDNPIFGTYTRTGILELGQYGSIEEAMNAAETTVHDETYPFDDYGEVDHFSPELVSIHDLHQRLVLSGQVIGEGIRWCVPVDSDDEARQLADQADQLRSEASLEAGWDNFSTAASLRWQARRVEARLVDPFWRKHARNAIAAVATT